MNEERLFHFLLLFQSFLIKGEYNYIYDIVLIMHIWPWSSRAFYRQKTNQSQRNAGNDNRGSIHWVIGVRALTFDIIVIQKFQGDPRGDRNRYLAKQFVGCRPCFIRVVSQMTPIEVKRVQILKPEPLNPSVHI